MLIDNFGRSIDYLRISVTDKCDLRCSYCMPKGFKEFEKPDHWLSFEEIERVVQAFCRLGTRNFRLTGGEPLLRKNLAHLVGRLTQIPEVKDLSLTTNGTQLVHMAAPLKEAGLHRLNVSLDSLKKECVKSITGHNALDKVLTGLMAAREAGFELIKINMVPLEGVNTGEIEEMVAFCIDNNYILRLIEVMPMGLSGQSHQYVNLQKIIQHLSAKFQLKPTHKIQGNGPAKYWSTPDRRFSLGLITPMSQHFCETCNRVRLSVDGTLYLCLGQEHHLSLRPLLRAQCSDQELENAIRDAILLKPKEHNFNAQPKKIMRIMSATGG